MCRHNGEDYQCSKCCFDTGYEDGILGVSYSPEYKNFDQVAEYKLGFKEGRTELRKCKESGNGKDHNSN